MNITSINNLFFRKTLPISDPAHRDLSYLKRNIQIAIIDDEDFPDLESYRCSGHSVTHFVDIDSFEQLIPYPIIICDIQGVGKKFCDSSEGAYIVNQVNELYPDKYVIVASSHSSSLRVAELISKADKKITRGNTDELKAAVLAAVKVMGDDIERWKRVRLHLIQERELDLFKVWEIEQEFIRALDAKDTGKLKSFIQQHTPDVVKGLLINFVSGLILS